MNILVLAVLFQLGLLLSNCGSALSFTRLGSDSFGLEISPDGSYKVFVSGQTWLASAPTFISANKQMFSTADGSLKLQHKFSDAGRDSLGRWKSFELLYMAATNAEPVYFQASFKRYIDIPDAIILSQNYPTGANDCNLKDDPDGLVSGFPTFDTTSSNSSLGFLAYGGIMFGDRGKSFGLWGKDNGKIASGLDSGPLVLFDMRSEVLIVSPFSQFMAASVMYDVKGNTANWGIMGNVNEIPQDFRYSTILFHGSSGINKAMEAWGRLMRIYYKKPPSFRESDFTINYLGYWTDNGAYYYYHTEKDKNYQQTILDVKKYADSLSLPYRYVQYDSWWYPKDRSPGGVVEWVSMPSIFPDGMQYVWNQTGWPSSAHNRWWSNETVYAKANGGKYDFIIEPERSMPVDRAFWTDLLRESKKWGLMTYEQDWLNVEFDKLKCTTSDVRVGRQWLREMGEGAANNGLTIQYCMCPSRAALQSLEIPVVTQARVSNDYQPGNEQWRIGVSSIFAEALGIAPFKDNFWTTTVQTGNTYFRMENYTALNAVVSTLSTGPVGPSDKIGCSNASLIMKSCNSEGLILKPMFPARAINAQIKKAAFGTSFSGPDGEVWTTHTEISGLVFGVILAADLKNTFDIGPTDAGFGDMFPHSRVFAYNPTTPMAADFSDKQKLQLAGCTKTDFCLYYTTPGISIGKHAVYIYGELSKWVPVSRQRVSGITMTTNDLEVYLQGAAEEKMVFSLVVDNQWLHFTCTMSRAGTAMISLLKQRCITVY